MANDDAPSSVISTTGSPRRADLTIQEPASQNADVIET